MPFILDIYDDEPFETRILQNSLEILAIVPIGRDPDIGAQYSVHVALIRLEPFDGDYKAELMFDVVEATSEGPRSICNGLETNEFLIGDDRKAALDVICGATTCILAQKQPDAIVMATFQSNLPRKALVKYAPVTSAIRRSGYDGGEGNTFEGQRIWMFVKSKDVS